MSKSRFRTKSKTPPPVRSENSFISPDTHTADAPLPQLSPLSHAIASTLTGDSLEMASVASGLIGAVAQPDQTVLAGALNSMMAEGLNPGAALITNEVAEIAQAVTSIASKLSPPADIASMPIHADSGSILLGNGDLPAGIADDSVADIPVSPHLDIPVSPLNIDDHFHTGRSITDFIAPSANYAPSLPSPPAADDVMRLVRDALNAAPSVLEDRNRLLRFYSPLTGGKRLYLASMQGTCGLSELDRYTLRLLSTDANIDLQDLLGKNVTAAFRLAEGGERPVNGYVTSFGFAGADGGLATYTAEITPWLWYLSKRINSRIYQDMTALDVIAQVFADYGGLADYQVRISQPLPVDNYIVQYNETDFHFVSRLLEKYGLFYYFVHRHDGHTLVICDDSFSADCCPPQPVHPEVPFNDGERVDNRDSLTRLSTQRTVQIGSVALNTYDYKNPSALSYLEQPTLAVQGDVPVLEIYDGNPAFAYRSLDEGNAEAKRRLESREWQAKQFFAESECRGLCVGHTFHLTRHFWFDRNDPDDAEFLVVGMQLEANNNFDGHSTAAASYRNHLTMIRRRIPYRPVHSHAWPVMRGPQSATVVGPRGQEIHTDALGRIKVQFPWDRHGRFDGGSSCWIRVSQPWAGRNWGTIAVPRIGQEVIVDFFEGDPDRPIVIGRLYNSEQTAPYALPDGAHMMGFHSNSTPGGGGHCEMVIHDKQGEELVNIHSQKNMNTTVLNDQATTVRHNRTVTVLNDQITAVTNNQTITVGNDQTIIVGNKQTTIVKNDQSNTVTDGAQTNIVHKSITTAALTENIQTTAHTNMDLVAETGRFTTTAKEDILVQTTDGGILIKGKTAIRLEVGSSSLEMHADGTILIGGKLVQIIGTDSVDLNPGWAPPVPEMPPGVDLEENIAQAKDMNIWDFYQSVRNKGPWDYKQQGSQYEDFGNFNFGMTGAAMGIPDDILLRGAGWAQSRAGTSNDEYGNWYDPPWAGSSYGDDPADQEMIRQGIEYYRMTHPGG
ncbi:MAG: type VI secretion system tip protein VgrG [Xanthomonadaceae bacterium]|jgi:type VI secretion system secreted protein VgrG|nr:type VI secretion system tip protein VgrG [Xanthomonadaceae bacterium]